MVQQISPSDLAARLSSGAPTYLLDVRQPWEHKLAALPGSHLIPLSTLSANLDRILPPADALVVAYCHHGIRSLSAAALLTHAGIGPVASLQGGIDAWSLCIDPQVPRY